MYYCYYSYNYYYFIWRERRGNYICIYRTKVHMHIQDKSKNPCLERLSKVSKVNEGANGREEDTNPYIYMYISDIYI